MSEQEPLAVSSLIGSFFDFLLDLFSPVLNFLNNFGWSIGDWTFFMPIIFFFLGRILERLRGHRFSNRIRLLFIVVGFLAGGVFEFHQPTIERIFFG